MDDKEFRRAILADPNTQTDDVTQAVAEDQNKQQYVDDVRSFNASLEAAMKVDAPDDLASKLLSIPQQESEKELAQQASERMKLVAANDNKYWQMAAAACFAFVLGLMLNLNGLQPESGMGAGEYALKTTRQGLQHVSQIEDFMPIDQLNAKLVSYGVQMQEDIGKVYSANSFHCSYNDVNVLHLVVDGEAGKINMYLLPKGNKLNNWDEFSDDRFNGKATRYSRADMMIVGEKGEPLDAFQSKVENSMQWSA